MTTQKALLFGGGGVHDYKAVCPHLQNYLTETGRFTVDYVIEDYDIFTASRLEAYDLVVLYHTGSTLSPEQASGLTGRIASGRGFVGIHGAADSFKNAPDYLAMLGGVFKSHPFVRDYLVSLCEDESGSRHPICEQLDGYTVEHWEDWPVYEYTVHDEQYLLEYDSRNTILATALFKGKAWPVAWARGWGAGRVFYCALGHDEAACTHPFFRDLVTAGAGWAADSSPTT